MMSLEITCMCIYIYISHTHTHTHRIPWSEETPDKSAAAVALATHFFDMQSLEAPWADHPLRCDTCVCVCVHARARMCVRIVLKVCAFFTAVSQSIGFTNHLLIS